MNRKKKANKGYGTTMWKKQNTIKPTNKPSIFKNHQGFS
jgi:hypothetical protein